MSEKNTLQQTKENRPKIQYKDGRIKDKAHFLSFEILAFFAANPDEMLTTRDMMAKFDIMDVKAVAARTRKLRNEGWITKTQEADTNKWRAGLPLNVYQAGSRILALHGINICD